MSTRMVSLAAGRTFAGDQFATQVLRERRDRIRSAWLKTFDCEPPTSVVADRHSMWDLACCVALLAWDGTLQHEVRDLVVFGDVGLDGRVQSGVVSNGTAAVPVHHLRDLAGAINHIEARRPRFRAVTIDNSDGSITITEHTTTGAS